MNPPFQSPIDRLTLDEALAERDYWLKRQDLLEKDRALQPLMVYGISQSAYITLARHCERRITQLGGTP